MTTQSLPGAEIDDLRADEPSPGLGAEIADLPADDPEPEPREVRFEVGPGRFIVGDEYGAVASPPVLFLHGGGQTRHAWGRAAERVADHGWRAVTVDHRGHGDSDWHPEAAYHFNDFTDDVECVARQLASGGTLPVLVGASLGGITSMIAETRHAGRSICRAVVLVDVTPRLQVSGVARILEFMGSHPDGFESLEAAADHIASFLPNRPRPSDLSGLQKNLRRRSDGRWRWHWDPRMMGDMAPDPQKVQQSVAEHLELASHLNVPVLLVRGGMSDVVSEEDAQEFLMAVPHAEYVDVANATHMVAGDRNDAFTDAVCGFLDRHIVT